MIKKYYTIAKIQDQEIYFISNVTDDGDEIGICLNSDISKAQMTENLEIITSLLSDLNDVDENQGLSVCSITVEVQDDTEI